MEDMNSARLGDLMDNWRRRIADDLGAPYDWRNDEVGQDEAGAVVSILRYAEAIAKAHQLGEDVRVDYGMLTHAWATSVPPSQVPILNAQ